MIEKSTNGEIDKCEKIGKYGLNSIMIKQFSKNRYMYG